MRRAALLLAAFASVASAATREVNLPVEQVWLRISQALAMRGISIESTDRAAGLIQAKGSFLENPEWFVCETRGGILKKADFTLAVALRETAGGTSIELFADANQSKLRYHHVLWFKTVHHWEHAECDSTGVLETQLLNRISAP